METAARDATELQSKHSTATSVHKLYTKKKTFGHSGTPRKFILRKGSRVSGAMVTIIHKDVITVTNGVISKIHVAARGIIRGFHMINDISESDDDPMYIKTSIL